MNKRERNQQLTAAFDMLSDMHRVAARLRAQHLVVEHTPTPLAHRVQRLRERKPYLVVAPADSFRSYFPSRVDGSEDAYRAYLQAPGDDITVVAEGRRDALLSIAKALPRDKPEKPAKQLEPANKHQGAKASKIAAKGGGRPRFTYPTEKKNPAQKAPAGAKKADEQEAPQGPDASALAQQIGVSPKTIEKTLQAFYKQPKLGGRDGYVRFMRQTLGRKFLDKHALGDDYFRKLYDAAAQEV